MGMYINPPDMSKEEFLEINGVEVEPAWPIADPSMRLVCLVDNGPFTAAAVAFDEREYIEFTDRSDPRTKKWYLVPIDKLEAAI